MRRSRGRRNCHATSRTRPTARTRSSTRGPVLARERRGRRRRASVILISGCQDNQLSLDGDRNGLFTQTLLGVWDDGKWKAATASSGRRSAPRCRRRRARTIFRVGALEPDVQAADAAGDLGDGQEGNARRRDRRAPGHHRQRPSEGRKGRLERHRRVGPARAADARGRTSRTWRSTRIRPDVDDLGDGVTATGSCATSTSSRASGRSTGTRRRCSYVTDTFDVVPGENFFEFPYDWRRDNRVAARKLAREAQGWLDGLAGEVGRGRREAHPRRPLDGRARLALLPRMPGRLARHARRSSRSGRRTAARSTRSGRSSTASRKRSARSGSTSPSSSAR